MDLIVNFPQPHHSSSSSQREKKVTFGDHSEFKFIEDLSRNHKSVLYFSRQQIETFKYQMAASIQTMHLNGMTMAQYAAQNAGDTSAFMGLETYLSKQTQQGTIDRRRAIVQAVLAEQSHQNCCGTYDPDALAGVSQAVSDLSVMRAEIIGLIHADKEIDPN